MGLLKNIIFPVLASAVLCMTSHAQEAKPGFSDLSAETQKEFNTKLALARRQYNAKQIDACQKTLAQLQAIHPNHPVAHNIAGACHVEKRHFKKAQTAFLKALDLDPGNTNVQFNLFEVKFVTQNWKEARDAFSALLPRLQPDQKTMKQLVQFKILICYLKLNNVDKATPMAALYADDKTSLYPYYARYALKYHNNKDDDALLILKKALKLFPDMKQHSVWKDTLIESGYLMAPAKENTDPAG